MTDEAAEFWRDYSTKLGEAVLRFSLGRYLSGMRGLEGPLWGLAIATDAGLRFHHFPHENWMAALSRVGGGGGAAPTEKTLFVPKERIRSAELFRESSWFKRLLSPSSPRLIVRYRPDGAEEGESTLVCELDRDADELLAALKGLLSDAGA